MNKFILMGRATADPDVRFYDEEKTIAKVNLAVDRRSKDAGTDFIGLTAFGRTAEFFDKYVKQGTKLLVEGTIQNNNYEKDGVKHYGFSFIVNNVEFAESKRAAEQNKKQTPQPSASPDDDFMKIPDEMEELPFN